MLFASMHIAKCVFVPYLAYGTLPRDCHVAIFLSISIIKLKNRSSQ